MPPISSSGSQVPAIPQPFTQQNTVVIFDDCNWTDLNKFPAEWSGGTAANESFNSNDFPDRVGVLKIDLATTALTQSIYGQQLGQMNHWTTLQWDFAFFFSGFDTTAGKNNFFEISLAGTGVSSSANAVSVGAKSTGSGASYPIANTLYISQDSGGIETHGACGGIGLITGAWHIFTVKWNASNNNVTLQLDGGAILATVTTAGVEAVANKVNALQFNWVSSVAAVAGTLAYIDWVKFTGTLASR